MENLIVFDSCVGVFIYNFKISQVSLKIVLNIQSVLFNKVHEKPREFNSNSAKIDNKNLQMY